jgi:fructan beta-fructosidase
MKQLSVIILILLLNQGCSLKEPSGTKEKYQPAIHFSPGKVWTSDAIGLVSEGSDYHLFYQFLSDSSDFGKLEWGHARSKDLIDWQHEMKITLPDNLSEVLLSTTVVDVRNTSGLGKDGKAPWVALALLHKNEDHFAGVIDFNNLALVFSLDNGQTWSKHNSKSNFTISDLQECKFPRLIWHDESRKWIMVGSRNDRVSFYSSTDLINWAFESDFGAGQGSHIGSWEYVDFFRLRVNGENETKWILGVSVDQGALNGGSGIQYFPGNFDGHEFEFIGEKPKWVDYGKDNYAGITCQDSASGRTLFVGWMNNWQYANLIPATGWRGILTFPRELSLVKKHNEYLLNAQPARELQTIPQDKKELQETEIEGLVELHHDFETPIELKLNFNTSNMTQFGFAEKFGIELSNATGEKMIIGYNNLEKYFFIDRLNAGNFIESPDFNWVNYAPYMENESLMDWHLIIDGSSVELFAKNGLIVMTERIFPTEAFNSIKLFADHGKIKLTNGYISQPKSNKTNLNNTR